SRIIYIWKHTSMVDATRSAIILFLFSSICASAGGLGATCREEAGEKQSALYVEQCLNVSPATHPPCNAANPCALIIDEIKRGCGFFSAAELEEYDLPYCRAYLAEEN